MLPRLDRRTDQWGYMDFALSEEQIAIQESIRRFSQERLHPGYGSRDKSGEIEPGLLREMGELGFIGADLDPDHGGLGAGFLCSGIIMEEIGWGDFNVGTALLTATLGGQLISQHAKPHVARDHLPKICRGEEIVALVLTEPSVGSDAANLKVTATKVAGGYHLNGEKTSISLAESAHFGNVFARTGEKPGARGVSAFLVDLNSDGITRSTLSDSGHRCVGRGSIFFDNAFVPEDLLLGRPGDGFVQVMQGFDYSRAVIGMQCIGLARRSLEETWQYVAERETFGRPIGVNQGVSFPLAEFETELECVRLLCMKALWLKDAGEPHSVEAAMVKYRAPRLAVEVAHQCLLLHGHGGYGKEYPFEQRLRDAIGLQIGDGTEQIMKMLIARDRSGLRV